MSEDESGARQAETASALAMGRLHGALEHASDPFLRIFAARILRDTLMAALRQEGHCFTDLRFHAWFAGLVTLSDTPNRQTTPPRALCSAILTELTHSSWRHLRDVTTQILPALLAPQDLDVAQDHARIHAVILEGRLLIEESARSVFQTPFAWLESLHTKVCNSIRFAPSERQISAASSPLRLSAADNSPASSSWAIELHCGDYLSTAGWLTPALPMVGLIRRDTLNETDHEIARKKSAHALRETVEGLRQKFVEAARFSLFAQQRLSGQRSTSRAPVLVEFLAGFGPLRSKQIENVMGISRLGVRGMIKALESLHMIEHRTIVGSHLYSVSPSTTSSPVRSDGTGDSALSRGALDDFNASLARLDELLANRPQNGP